MQCAPASSTTGPTPNLTARLWAAFDRFRSDEGGSALIEYVCISATGTAAAAAAGHLWGARLARTFAQVAAAMP